MTPFMKVFGLLEQRPCIRRSDVIAALGSPGAATRVLAQLHERGDIRRIGMGIYALPGTPNMQKVGS